MNITHKKLDLNVNIEPLKRALKVNADLFGKINLRFCNDDSPHKEVTDIWVRFNDIEPFHKSGDYSGIMDEHESIWYENAITPIAKDICSSIMSYCKGVLLGGVLITKLKPGGMIYPHTDHGWHADYYEKYYIPIQNSPGASFYFDDGVIENPKEGSVWWFDNSFNHWVENNSPKDRIAMIVCLRKERE